MFHRKVYLYKLFYAFVVVSLIIGLFSPLGATSLAAASTLPTAEGGQTLNGLILEKAIRRNANQQRPTLLAAGDENWDAAFGIPGMDASVYALVIDPSGNLYAGGDFTTAGGVTTNYIASWDGSTWKDLKGGMDNSVWALAIDSNGNLYAGGDFTTAGGVSTNRVARWDGTDWHPLGNGLSGPVSALIFDDTDQLYVGGSFNVAGGISAERIARWDGNQWYALDTGMNSPVRSLAFDSSGDLFAGGVFNVAGGVSAERIARWDGNQWHALGSGLNNTAWAMQFDSSGDLYVGGGFNIAGGLPANHVARWDGTNWYAVGGGVDNIVRALALDGDGRLSVGGDFTTAGGLPFNYIARWDGTNWLALGSGMNAPVRALAPNNLGDLYVGGDFTTAGDKTASYIAWWHRSFYPPVASDDSYTTPEDVVLAELAPGVLGNDTDPDGNPLKAVLQSGPSDGTLNLDLNGSFVYTPTLNFNGSTTFTYFASDGIYTDTATVTITVTSVNDPPIAVSDVYTATEDNQLSVAAPGVLANDLEVDGDPMTVSLNIAPSHGNLALSPTGSFTYMPEADYYGVDGFTYDLTDGVFTSTATVTLTVLSVNDPPVALGDNASTDQDNPVTTGDVLANDTDIEGDTIYVDSFDDSATAGLVTDNGDGTFDYDPNGAFDWLGDGEQDIDTFTYTAADGNGGFDTAAVTITITGFNDVPMPQDDGYTTDEDIPLIVPTPGVLANDTDVDGDVLTAVALTDPAHGTLLLAPDGSFTFNPDENYYGFDSFLYEVSDGVLTGTAFVSLTIGSVNDAPIALDDAYETDEDTPLVVPSAGVLTNDSDAEGDPLTAVLGDLPFHGSLTLNPDGSFNYNPEADYFGSDSFTYYAYDGTDLSIPATVTLTVNPVNDPPAADDDLYATPEDIPLVVSAPGVLANDSDVDGDPLSAFLIDGPVHGTLSLESDGSFTYMPDPNYYGSDSFTYHASDGTLESGTASVSIMVEPLNDAPLVEAGSDQNALEGQLLNFSGSFSDPGLLGGGIHAETILWDFGDGDTAADTLNPSHTFVDNSVYTVTLTVTDDQGGTGYDSLLVTVSNVAPSLEALNDRTVVAGESLDLTISFTDPGIADHHSVEVTWDDGHDDSYAVGMDLREISAAHTYSSPGSYMAAVTVMDDDGGVDTLAFTVTVIPSAYTLYLPMVTRQH